MVIKIFIVVLGITQILLEVTHFSCVVTIILVKPFMVLFTVSQIIKRKTEGGTRLLFEWPLWFLFKIFLGISISTLVTFGLISIDLYQQGDLFRIYYWYQCTLDRCFYYPLGIPFNILKIDWGRFYRP